MTAALEDVHTRLLAGEGISVTDDRDGLRVAFRKAAGRSCGSCQLCCKLVPVPPLRKPAGQRCQHQRTGKGCMIYATRPVPCRVWTCRWLADAKTAHLPRPDRAHYVIDLDYDYVDTVPDDTSPGTRVSVLQVWVDPAFPEAHRAPELRAYMAEMAATCGLATLVRFSQAVNRALIIFPPALAHDHEWWEFGDNNIRSRPDDTEQPWRLVAREGTPA